MVQEAFNSGWLQKRDMFLRCQCGYKSARRMTDEEKDQRVQQMRVCSLKLTY